MLPTASAEIKNSELKHGDTYQYDVQRLNTRMLSGGLAPDFWLGFYDGGQGHGGTQINEGATFTLVVVNQTSLDPSTAAATWHGDGQTWLANATEEWNSLWVRPSTVNEVFSLHIFKHEYTLFDGYDVQGFFVDQVSFIQSMAGSYFANTTSFGASTSFDSNATIDGSYHTYHTEYTEFYQVGTGMLMEYTAFRTDSVDIPNGTASARNLDIHIVAHVSSTTHYKISYHPMFIALLPLVALRRKSHPR